MTAYTYNRTPSPSINYQLTRVREFFDDKLDLYLEEFDTDIIPVMYDLIAIYWTYHVLLNEIHCDCNVRSGLFIELFEELHDINNDVVGFFNEIRKELNLSV